MKRILLLIILIISISQISSWFGCRDFKDAFHFLKYSVLLELDNLVHNDTDLPFALIRAYHNKVIQTVINIFSAYLRFWDILFLVNLLLPIGILGLLWGLLDGSKVKIVQILTIIASILPFVEIFFKPFIYFPIKIILLSLPILIISIYGISIFLKEKRGKLSYLIVTATLLLSIWWRFVMPAEIWSFCLK